MKSISFYAKKPSLLRSAGWFSFGITPWMAPGILSKALISNGTIAGVVSGMAYAVITVALAYPVTRQYVTRVHRTFWDEFRNYNLSKRMSAKIRETFKNAGLVKTEIREITRKDRVRRKEIVHYPETKIWIDDANYYLEFRMIHGQTEQQWERKLNAFGHTLQCKMVSSRIRCGLVEITLQHGEIKANAVIYKKDTTHTLSLGYATSGLLAWDFDHFPHALVVGPTGTGKSTFVRNLLIQFRPEWTVKVADGKQVEFTHLKDFRFDVASNKNGFIRLVEGAQLEVNKRFKQMEQERRNHYADIGKEPYFLVIDEAIYLLEALSSKKEKETGESERDRILGLLRDISLRGRAAGVQLIMIFQRPDSSFIPTVIRDNLMAKVVLGGSETALEMAFGKEKSKVLDPVSLGNGYACIGDGKVDLFRFPDYAQSKFLDDLEGSVRTTDVSQKFYLPEPSRKLSDEQEVSMKAVV